MQPRAPFCSPPAREQRERWGGVGGLRDGASFAPTPDPSPPRPSSAGLGGGERTAFASKSIPRRPPFRLADRRRKRRRKSFLLGRPEKARDREPFPARYQEQPDQAVFLVGIAVEVRPH